MRAAILAVVGILAGMPALASDKTDVVATVKAYNDAFTKGDTAAANALCASPAVVIDDFAPHVWQGATACGDWAAAFAAFAKAGGDTDAVVTIGKSHQLTVTGDRAYAVFSAKFAYKEHGKPVLQSGIWTFTLQKLDAGWRITGWAWAGE
jgi:ketosteroid isomerase-like protein